ncbi:hypothetical protein MMC29_006827 [Sticta canariensis]|nr:hypothetical protein [Sticta canariensis]
MPQLPLTEIPVEDTQIASGPIRLDQFARPLELSFGGDSAAPQQLPSKLGDDIRSSDYDGRNGWANPTDQSAVPQALAFEIFDTPSSNLNDFDIWNIN